MNMRDALDKMVNKLKRAYDSEVERVLEIAVANKITPSYVRDSSGATTFTDQDGNQFARIEMVQEGMNFKVKTYIADRLTRGPGIFVVFSGPTAKYYVTEEWQAARDCLEANERDKRNNVIGCWSYRELRKGKED